MSCDYCQRNVLAALASTWVGDRHISTRGKRICLECLPAWATTEERQYSMKQVTTFQAFDGAAFQTREECAAYEAKHSAFRLAGLTVEQIDDALNGRDNELADAIEELGTRIARDRRKRGELRRAKNKKDEHGAEQEEVQC